MKFLNAMILVIFASPLAAQAQALPDLTQREVQVAVNGAYVPEGFTSQSDAYVVVNGVFQNGCYKWKRAEVTHKSDFKHEVKIFASVTQGMCPMVLVLYQRDVILGKLAPGQHNVIFDNADGTFFEKTMRIQ